VKYILLWLVTGALMWSIFNWFSVKKVEIIQSGESLFSGKSELFVLGSVFLLVCIHIGLTQYVKTQVKQEMQSSFQSELTSQQELNPEGFYKVDENGLPVWQATFDHLSTNEVLNYSVYSNLMSSEPNFIMNWD